MKNADIIQKCITYMENKNPYKVTVKHMQNGRCSMQDYIEKNTIEICDSKVTKDEGSLIYRIISKSLEEYLRHYEASFPFKQRTREVFYKWLRDIENEYGICDSNDWSDEFWEDFKSKDVAIRLVKELHDRNGVTKKTLSDKLGITQRAVLNALNKLEAEGGNENGEPYYLGDQPVHVRVGEVNVTEDDVINNHIRANAKKFYTPNTLHPIILQENMLQVYVLLKCLLYTVDDEEGKTLLYSVAQDIWFQLSEYAKEKIRELMEKKDKHLICYLDALDELAPTQEVRGFITEEQMKLSEELSFSEESDFYDKLPCRRV